MKKTHGNLLSLNSIKQGNWRGQLNTCDIKDWEKMMWAEWMGEMMGGQMGDSGEQKVKSELTKTKNL